MSQKYTNTSIKNYIAIGVYSAIYLLAVAVSALLTVFLVPGYSYIFIPAVSALVSGSIFMLMVAKVRRFGAMTTMAGTMGVFFLLTGRFPMAIVICLLFGLLADLIGKASDYKNKKGLLLSYVVFSFNLTGPIIPMFLAPQLYAEDLVSQGKDASYIESAFSGITSGTIPILVVAIVITAVVGGIFGQRMIHKHFERAGIV